MTDKSNSKPRLRVKHLTASAVADSIAARLYCYPHSFVTTVLLALGPVIGDTLRIQTGIRIQGLGKIHGRLIPVRRYYHPPSKTYVETQPRMDISITLEPDLEAKLLRYWDDRSNEVPGSAEDEDPVEQTEEIEKA